jgi:hypothetical protein
MGARLLVVVLFLLLTGPSHGAEITDYTTAPIEKLIADLTLIGDPGPGLESTANFEGFIADDGPYQFTSGVLGSPVPMVPPQMRELVRRGPAALPALLRHIDDRRLTKLSVGGSLAELGNGAFFVSQGFSEEYDPRTLTRGEKPCDALNNCWGKGFDRPYTLAVGDICYGLIGQIVNRHLVPVRYQPTAILIVNSPVQRTALASRVRRDWIGIRPSDLRQLLLADIQEERDYRGALARLRRYFAESYGTLQGLDLKKRAAFEFEEKQAARQAEMPYGQTEPPKQFPLNDGVDKCQTLPACVQRLQSNMDTPGIQYEGEEAIATRLEMFGEAAKQELLQRITDPNPDWRSVANAVLSHWHSLTETDLPFLVDSLRMDGLGVTFDAIAKIDSADAIAVLIVDLRKRGADTDGRSALVSLGPKALPQLLPVLADDETWEGAAEIVSEMRETAAQSAAGWAAISIDPKRPRQQRLGALRGLAAMRDIARPARETILPLLRSSDRALRSAADAAIKAMQ